SGLRGGYGGRLEAANGGIDSIQSRSYQGSRPAEAGRARVRVLRGSQAAVRSLASPRGRSPILRSAPVSPPPCAGVHTAFVVHASVAACLCPGGANERVPCALRAEHPSRTACSPPCRASSIGACSRV